MDKINEKIFGNWLMNMPKIPKEKKIELLKEYNYPSYLYGFSEGKIKSFLRDDNYVETWKEFKRNNDPIDMWKELESKGIDFSYYGDDEYPKRLMKIIDPPFGLYYVGRLPGDNEKTVGIIGARENSAYGKCMAEHFASRFAACGVTVISGMATGIDGISQRAALAAGGKSYGVLGSGVDVIYPRTNTKLYYDLIDKGGVMSEALPGTAPHAGLFPVRNRIISALSDVILVVEARSKSGTFITVDMALDQNKEVYAIPGRCTDTLSIGCNQLIKQGAGMALTPENILEDMGWLESNNGTNSEKVDNNRNNGTNLTTCISDMATEIINIMDINPMSQDEIVSSLRVKNCTASVPLILQGLLELEMLGLVYRNSGQYALISTKLEKF